MGVNQTDQEARTNQNKALAGGEKQARQQRPAAGVMRRYAVLPVPNDAEVHERVGCRESGPTVGGEGHSTQTRASTCGRRLNILAARLTGVNHRFRRV